MSPVESRHGKDRWLGAIPYRPGSSRVWVRGPLGSLKPNAAHPVGATLWALVGLVALTLVLLAVYALIG